MKFPLTLFLLIQWSSRAQKNPNFSDGRGVIIHLNEWKWTDIAEECERFLQYQTYGGVQVSPPNENLVVAGRPWWERYRPVSYNLTTRSGTESEFGEMVLRCNESGIRIYADVVVNHMTASTGIGTAGNKAFSDVKMYPALPYNPQDFHPSCNISNYLNPDVVRNCELQHLLDLDQSTQYVRDTIVTYLNHLLDLGVAGFRIDSAKYMNPVDLKVIYDQLKDTNYGPAAFIYQDVPVFTEDTIGPDDYQSLGAVIEPKYGPEISRIFTGRANFTDLSTWGLVSPSTDAVVSVDDHTSQRQEGILTYKDLKAYKMALAFMLAHPYGHPKIISSYFFQTLDIGPPMDTSGNVKSPVVYSDGSCGNGYVCEHRWPQIANMVTFRNLVQGTEVENWWSEGRQFAFSRGDKGFVAFSDQGDLDQDVQTSLPGGTYCDVISGKLEAGKCTGKEVVVDGNGVARVVILGNEYDGVVAVHVNNKM